MLADLSAEQLQVLLTSAVTPDRISELVGERDKTNRRRRQRVEQLLRLLLQTWQANIHSTDAVVRTLRAAVETLEARLGALTEAGLDVKAGYARERDLSVPSALFRPENYVLRLIGREAELTSLRDWCDADSAFGVWGYAAHGGTGKTRLALECLTRQRQAGWLCASIVQLPWLERFANSPLALEQPLLLLLDYADHHVGGGLDSHLIAPLRALVERSPKVRLLLLSRVDEAWWEHARCKLSQVAPSSAFLPDTLRGRGRSLLAAGSAAAAAGQ